MNQIGPNLELTKGVGTGQATPHTLWDAKWRHPYGVGTIPTLEIYPSYTGKNANPAIH